MKLVGEGERELFRMLVGENGLYTKETDVAIEREHASYADYAARGSKNGTVVDVTIKIHAAEEGSGEGGAEGEGERSVQFPEGDVPSLFRFSGKESRYIVRTFVIKDTGLVYEVAMECVRDALKNMEVPEYSTIFKGSRSTNKDIYRKTAKETRAEGSEDEDRAGEAEEKAKKRRKTRLAGEERQVAPQKSKQEEEAEQTDPEEGRSTARTYGVVGNRFLRSPILQENASSDAVVHVVADPKRGTVKSITIERGGVPPCALREIISSHLSEGR